MPCPGSRRRCALAAGCLLIIVAGCTGDAKKRQTVELSVAGRHVRATSDQVASIAADRTNHVIIFGGKRVIVQRERVLFEGKEQAKLSAIASRVVIEYINGNLSVVADGDTIREASPPKL